MRGHRRHQGHRILQPPRPQQLRYRMALRGAGQPGLISPASTEPPACQPSGRQRQHQQRRRQGRHHPSRAARAHPLDAREAHRQQYEQHDEGIGRCGSQQLDAEETPVAQQRQIQQWRGATPLDARENAEQQPCRREAADHTGSAHPACAAASTAQVSTLSASVNATAPPVSKACAAGARVSRNAPRPARRRHPRTPPPPPDPAGRAQAAHRLCRPGPRPAR
ncbi:hypothetical protein [Paracidovorax citrulli]|uniref:Uncharacterized protein n=1 Tax=Paracidovorax citrulli (strain AAC00-1) TaxID=397945 RepID=A1TQ59_PARC0|nr:hypothetical protein [Paracidovorax citrulli]ABM33097.1 hypothetical protein Aave_2524 [Paracidovorax citrulli AAC00-1]ATG92953.1 hypothetical protein CQB05_01915 [Paracidovorax citrulli]WIY42121.1 hypothetical protein QRO12_14230 [Paracidovorax citrulli]